MSGFQNTPALHERAKTYSALSFDGINFFKMANLFLLSRKAFVMCYCFRAPIRTFFFDACQMNVKLCVLVLFPVPQTGRSHVINILIASFFFGPYCKLRIFVFFYRFMTRPLRAWAINRWEKNSVRNLQYGPKTRLIRGIYVKPRKIKIG